MKKIRKKRRQKQEEEEERHIQEEEGVSRLRLKEEEVKKDGR